MITAFFEYYLYYTYLIVSFIEQLWLLFWSVSYDLLKKTNAEVVIAIMALYFAFKEFYSKAGHHLEIMYAISSSLYQQPRISDLWIYNKKNKIEVITEINVLFGANCVLQLKKFADDPFILNPNEIKRVSLEQVSLYAVNLQPVNMGDALVNKKIKKTFYLTTPNGRIQAKRLKQIPYDTFIHDTLTKGMFYHVYHRKYLTGNQVLDFKIKYSGFLIENQQKKYPFYIYQDGLLCVDHMDYRLRIDLEKYDTENKIKRFLSRKKILPQKYAVEINQRPSFIEKSFKSLEEKDISSVICTKWQYIFCEPLSRWLNRYELYKARKKYWLSKLKLKPKKD